MQWLRDLQFDVTSALLYNNTLFFDRPGNYKQTKADLKKFTKDNSKNFLLFIYYKKALIMYNNQLTPAGKFIHKLPVELLEKVFQELTNLEGIQKSSNTCFKWKQILSWMFNGKKIPKILQFH